VVYPRSTVYTVLHNWVGVVFKTAVLCCGAVLARFMEGGGDNMYGEVNIKDMVGKVFTSVTATDDEMVFSNADEQYRFYHVQDCCETVMIDDICGDLGDLVGEPLLMADDVSGTVSDPGPKKDGDWEDESYTFTFYKFATRKGYVDVRWYGESNGYYSESVDLDYKKLR
jgi:hypothetical protein